MFEGRIFEFAAPGRIVFGPGCLSRLGDHLLPDSPVLLLRGKNPERAAPVRAALEAKGLAFVEFSVGGEPDLETMAAVLELARNEQVKAVLSFGGGSALDTGKAAASLLANPGEIFDYLEGVGKGKALPKPSLPFYALPTTAGTGSEASRNTVILCRKEKSKVSLRSPFLFPRLALVDPELTLSLPRRETAESGLDALTQLLEGFFTAGANPFSDGFAREGLKAAGASLERAWKQPDDLAARTGMSLAACCSGVVLANAGLGAVHGLAAPLGGMFQVPHGAACARLLPLVTAANLLAQGQEPAARERYAEAAALLTGNERSEAGDLPAWLAGVGERLRIRPLREFGVGCAAVSELIRRAEGSSSMRGNPVKLSARTLAGILEEAIG